MWGSAIDANPFENALYGVTAMHMNSQDIWDDIGVVWSATSPSATEGQSTFLGTSLHMQAQDWDEIGTDWYRKATDGGTSILDGGESNDQAIDEFLATHRSPDATWTINMSNYDPYGNGVGLVWHNPAEWNGEPREYSQWFVAGGAFREQSLISVDAPNAALPSDAGDAVEWLLA